MPKKKFNHGDAETRLSKAYERLGTSEPKCLHCEVTDPHLLQVHHIAGRVNDGSTVILCLNHHARITNAQKDHPEAVDSPSHPANRLGNLLLGLAELLVTFIEILREAGIYLIEVARSSSIAEATR